MNKITVTKENKTEAVKKGIVLRLHEEGEEMELNIRFVGYKTTQEMAEELIMSMNMLEMALKEGENVC